MNYLSFSGIMIFFSSIACSVFVFLARPQTTLKLTWALFSLGVSFWGLGLFITYTTAEYDNALFWARFLNLSAITVLIFFLHFVFLFTNKFQSKRNELISYYILGAGVIILALIYPNEFIPDLSPKSGFKFYPNPGRIYYLFPFMFGFFTSYGCYLLFSEAKKRNNVSSYQARYILLGVSIGFLGAGTTFFEVFDLRIYPFGTSFVMLYVILTTYAIVRYRFMDIKIAITRASIFLFVYTLVLGLPFFCAYGLGFWKQALWLMMVLATTGPFIYMYLQKKAEQQLLLEQHQYQMTLRQASLGMGQIKELGRLLKLIVHIVSRAVSIEHCQIYLLHEDSNQFILKASRGWADTDKRQLSMLPSNSALVMYLKETKESIVSEEMEHYVRDFGGNKLKKIEEMINKLDGALIVPSFMDQKLIAILVLGRKKSGKPYSQDDLAVFSILANQAGLAIENAQFYEKMKETHKQLLKAEKMATIGTMADGLSHQLNNRLHAMGFIAGDALDTLKLKKKEEMSPDMRQLFDEIEHSLKRIEDNVKRGGEIVEGLLKYTRKGSEGFEAINLNSLLDASLEMAQYKIKLNAMHIDRHFNDATPRVKGNFTQLQEVFFNLIDNAYDAMMQRKEELKEPGYQPNLEISAHALNGKLQILIQDNGMGVKKEDMGKLFTPFFTTKLSSKKGTGLGLYVIRQIIEENHDGRVRFTSKYRQGSQTSILLPIAN